MSPAPTRDYEVLINGGGITGLTLALMLAQNNRAGPQRIGVIEARPPEPRSPSGQAIGLRVVALAPSSRSILEHCNAWSRLPAEHVGCYRRMFVWYGDGAPRSCAHIEFDAAEQGVPELGYITGNDILREQLWAMAQSNECIDLISNAAPVDQQLSADCVRLTLDDGKIIGARLLVGADGTRSWVRGQFLADIDERQFGQRGLVLRVEPELAHEQTAWQRFLPGGPVALLPLADGHVSVVWSLPDHETSGLMELDDQRFGQAISRATSHVLGELSPASERVSFPLASLHARRYTGRRVALIGDAAHQIHPLAGQGVNLGLLDAAALAETLAGDIGGRRADPGDPLVLRRYERWRKGDNLLTLRMMEALHGLFTSDVPRLAGSAARGMALMDRLTPLKRRLADHALGRTRRAPRAARAIA